MELGERRSNIVPGNGPSRAPAPTGGNGRFGFAALRATEEWGGPCTSSVILSKRSAPKDPFPLYRLAVGIFGKKWGCIFLTNHVDYRYKQLYAIGAGLLFCPQRREKESDLYEQKVSADDSPGY